MGFLEFLIISLIKIGTVNSCTLPKSRITSMNSSFIPSGVKLSLMKMLEDAATYCANYSF